MLERDIEKKVCAWAVRHHDAIAYKFTSPARRSVPDRMLVLPEGRIVFIEFKAYGKTVSAGQDREIRRLRERGQVVLVIDNVEVGITMLSKILGG